MKSKFLTLSVLVTLSMFNTYSYCQTKSYLPKKMEFAHILKQSDKNFFIISQSDCYNFRKAYPTGNIGNEQDSSVSVIYEYEPDLGKFRQISTFKTCKMFFGAIMGHNKIYIVGGFNSHMEATNDMQELDLSTSEWKKLPSMKDKRAKFACELSKNKIFALNGVGNAGKYEVFDIATNKWMAFEPQLTGLSIVPPDTIAASDIIDASIYFISSDGKRLFEYHTDNNILSQKSNPTFAKKDFSFTANNKKIYVADGSSHGKIDGRIYVYLSLSDKWEPAGYNPFARTGEAMLFYNNSLFFIGGTDASQSPTDLISISKPMK